MLGEPQGSEVRGATLQKNEAVQSANEEVRQPFSEPTMFASLRIARRRQLGCGAADIWPTTVLFMALEHWLCPIDQSRPSVLECRLRRIRYGALQTKLAASLVLPTPLYAGTCG